MSPLKWWQTAVFYQIYPRSFADGNGDGIGDLQGIIERLDYLKELGIDALWLSPHYPSPQFDCGYDIADYTDVDPEYGTLEEFQSFLQAAHERDLRVILDLVLNHTSDRHPWFQESRSSRDNPKRDWYIWRDGKDDNRPPNNWNAAFDDCAWTYDPQTEQWYYHFFFAEQPDLNWRNPEVKQAIWQAVRFWLDLGVDGFRLDAIGTLFEDPDMPDHQAEVTMAELFQRYMAGYPEQPDPQTSTYLEEQRKLMNKYQVDQPGIHELLQDLRLLIDEYDDRVLVGEADEVAYHGDGNNELHLVFNFPLMRTSRLTPDWIRNNQQQRLSSLPPGAWPCNTLGNHDSSRVLSHFGDGNNDQALARLSLALMLTLKGTPFLYNGEEIGMADLMLPAIEEFRDNLGIWIYREVTQNFGVPADSALQIVQMVTRDKCRTPLQWENAPNAGFSPDGVRPWLPVHPNYADGVNVADQQDRPESMLSFYREMLAVRKSAPALIAGSYRALHEDAEDFLAFVRSSPDPVQRCLVVLNYADRPVQVSFDEQAEAGRLIYSSTPRQAQVDVRDLELAPFEILIVELAR